MEIFILDQEETNLDIALNSLTKGEENKSSENLDDILVQVDLGIEPAMRNIGGVYVTSKGNAAEFTDMYGWHFARVVIPEL